MADAKSTYQKDRPRLMKTREDMGKDIAESVRRNRASTERAKNPKGEVRVVGIRELNESLRKTNKSLEGLRKDVVGNLDNMHELMSRNAKAQLDEQRKLRKLLEDRYRAAKRAEQKQIRADAELRRLAQQHPIHQPGLLDRRMHSSSHTDNSTSGGGRGGHGSGFVDKLIEWEFAKKFFGKVRKLFSGGTAEALEEAETVAKDTATVVAEEAVGVALRKLLGRYSPILSMALTLSNKLGNQAVTLDDTFRKNAQNWTQAQQDAYVKQLWVKQHPGKTAADYPQQDATQALANGLGVGAATKDLQGPFGGWRVSDLFTGGAKQENVPIPSVVKQPTKEPPKLPPGPDLVGADTSLPQQGNASGMKQPANVPSIIKRSANEVSGAYVMTLEEFTKNSAQRVGDTTIATLEAIDKKYRDLMAKHGVVIAKTTPPGSPNVNSGGPAGGGGGSTPSGPEGGKQGIITTPSTGGDGSTGTAASNEQIPTSASAAARPFMLPKSKPFGFTGESSPVAQVYSETGVASGVNPVKGINPGGYQSPAVGLYGQDTSSGVNPLGNLTPAQVGGGKQVPTPSAPPSSPLAATIPAAPAATPAPPTSTMNAGPIGLPHVTIMPLHKDVFGDDNSTPDVTMPPKSDLGVNPSKNVSMQVIQQVLSDNDSNINVGKTATLGAAVANDVVNEAQPALPGAPTLDSMLKAVNAGAPGLDDSDSVSSYTNARLPKAPVAPPIPQTDPTADLPGIKRAKPPAVTPSVPPTFATIPTNTSDRGLHGMQTADDL